MSSPTLHDELLAILAEKGNRWMTTSELADEVNARGRYEKKDGSTVTALQIRGRSSNYGHLFDPIARPGGSVVSTRGPTRSRRMWPAIPGRRSSPSSSSVGNQ